MNRTIPLISALMLFVLAGCSGTSNPVNPGITSGNPVAQAVQTHLWGYFDVFIDLDTQTATATLNRQASFTANVVNFVNKGATNLKFKINSTPIGGDYVDVDIDVSITHPFPGLPQYNGYDVRGIFMGDGSGSLSNGVVYPVNGTDQYMLPDPVDSIGGPDGYTRWYNITEFAGAGMPLFLYTQGKYASSGFAGTATLCPYKYFTDGMQANDDAFTYLKDHADQNGVFSSGATNTRNYYLRFPNSKGIKYGYAIIADWMGTDPQYHPANAKEAVLADVSDNSSVFYVDGSNNGGNIDLDFSLFNWHGQPSTISIESTVLSTPYQLTGSEMVPVGGNDVYSTWHVDIPADNVTGLDQSYFIIAEYSLYDYSNDFGVPNLVGTSPLTAYFGYKLYVSPSSGGGDPDCVIEAVTPMPAKGWDVGVPVEFDSSGSSDPDGGTLSFEWDFDGNGVFGETPADDYAGTDDNPTHTYTANYTGQVCVRVSDDNGGESECCMDVEIIAYPSKNLPLRDDAIAFDLAIDPADGDLKILYDDGEIWKYLIADFYQFGAKWGDLNVDLGATQPLTGCKYMDIAGNSATVITGKTTGTWVQNRVGYYKADETPFGCMIWPGSTSVIYDAIGFGSLGAHAYTAGYANGRDYLSDHYQEISWYPEPDYCTTHFTSYWYNDSVTKTGPTQIYWPWMIACESDKYGDWVWFIENPDFYASRWSVQGMGTYGSLVYDNAYFGTGSQTDNDNGWNNAKDITRDNQNRYFVLDQLSNNTPRIKMWTIDGNNTTSEGGFGNSTSIDSPPQRIEGGDFGGEVITLHGTAAPYKISVFLPAEMP